jgi:hypothetical protein
MAFMERYNMAERIRVHHAPFSVSRIIHPVGQGAFYTERIIVDDRCYNIVYDCGAGNRKQASTVLKREIASYYTHNDIIDILFVSHFDNDHINGIRELMKHTRGIKNIVVPLIDKSDFWFYCVENDNFRSFYNSLEEIAEKVYKVKSAFEDDRNINDIRPLDLSEGEKGVFTIQNATKMLLGRDIDWCYIPFNYDQKNRISILKIELSKYGITEDVLCDNWEVIAEHLDEIKKAYKNVVSDGANKTSLILYSGGSGGDYDCEIHQYNWPFYYYDPYVLRVEGCLYFGDNDLNQLNLLCDLQQQLGPLNYRIGTIQVPHHGAIKNFNNQILHIFRYHSPVLYFASFGKYNSYGHPSYRVVEDIEYYNPFIGVTEDRNSALVEIIYPR